MIGANGEVIMQSNRVIIDFPVIFNSSLQKINVVVAKGVHPQFILSWATAMQLGFSTIYNPPSSPFNDGLRYQVDMDARSNNAELNIPEMVDRDIVEKIAGVAIQQNGAKVNPTEPCNLPYADYDIELKANPLDIHVRQYSLAKEQSEFFDMWISAAINTKWISKVDPNDEGMKKKVPIGMPPTFVPHETKGFRVCFDGRAVNDGTADTVPDDGHGAKKMITDMHAVGWKHITRLDMTDAYSNMKLRDNNKYYLCFSHKGVVYKFERMMFGLKNAGIHLNKVMSSLLAGHGEYTRHFVDDIFIFTNGTAEEHAVAVAKVVGTLTDANLLLNAKKTQLYMKQIEMLGMVVSGSEISVHPDKYKAIVDADTEMRTLQDIQVFLGRVNYCSPFIPGYAEVCAPLRAVQTAADKRLKAEWKDKVKKYNKKPLTADEKKLAEEGVIACKNHMVKVVKLAAFSKHDDEGEYIIHTDASKRMIGSFIDPILRHFFSDSFTLI